MKNNPPVTIGMPIYNAGDGLRKVLDSLLGQTFTNFSLIISDNASTDNTSQICQAYAVKDTRIQYVRQNTNMGAEANFLYVLSASRSKYFMWAAGDDLRSLDFIEVNYNFLEENPTYLGSTSMVSFDGREPDEVAMGDESLASDDRFQRILTVFRTWHANGRFYSLFRCAAVQSWEGLSGKRFLGSDWTLVTHLAAAGKLNRTTSGWLKLGRSGVSNTTDIFARYRQGCLDWVFPFNRLAWDTLRLMRGANPSQIFLCIFRLLRLNVQAFIGQFKVMVSRSRIME